MTEELKVKINDSIKEKFVGNTIFTNDELNEMYNLSSCILRNVANTWGSTIKYSDYSLIFVTLVNIAKEWNSEEDAFFEYVYKNDGGKKCTGDWNLKRVFRIMACKGLERNGREINYY